jgi:hypothetical protein
MGVALSVRDTGRRPTRVLLQPPRGDETDHERHAVMRRSVLWVVLAGLAVGGCDAIFGIRDHDLASESEGSDAGGTDAVQDDGSGETDDGGDADRSSDGGDGSRDARADSSPGTQHCMTLDDCPMGENCVGSTCVSATAGCSAQKSAYPQSPDGVYWITPGGTPQRAFCDMQQQTELCTEMSAQHVSRTRDGSGLPYVMSSLLVYSQGVCQIWAVRSTDGYPFDALNPAGMPKLGTCAALGFISDGTIGTCPYGSADSACGYSVNPLLRYGNLCSGCQQGDGTFSTYQLQGPMVKGSVLSSVDGSTKTTCKIR